MNPCKKTIEWADFTANPFTGCLHDCDYCYARRMANRLRRVKGTVYYWLATRGYNPFQPAIHTENWNNFFHEMKWKRKKPTRVFLGSMADLGGDWKWKMVGNHHGPTDRDSNEIHNSIKWLAKETPQHTYLILTKNPVGLAGEWPDNCHIGVSADNEKDAFDRTLSLMENVRAKVRWISLEPLLEPVTPRYLRGLDWIVIGGQTGPGAPPVPIESVEEIVGFTRRKGIPLFVKKNIRDKHPGTWPMEFPY